MSAQLFTTTLLKALMILDNTLKKLMQLIFLLQEKNAGMCDSDSRYSYAYVYISTVTVTRFIKRAH